MPWQELIDHVNGNTVTVRSRDGNEYPAKTARSRLNDLIYSQIMNEARDHVDFWVWVEFDGDSPRVEDFSCGTRPDRPPWEYP